MPPDPTRDDAPQAAGTPPVDVATAAWRGASVALAALGRVFICVDGDMRVLHASSQLDGLLGAGAAAECEGRPLAELLGGALFGPEGTLRHALLAGERHEGWRGHLRRGEGEPVLVSLSVAPVPPEDAALCDASVRAIVVLRPADQGHEGAVAGPTVVSGVVSRSPSMVRILTLVDNLRHSDATVLITGESGTGKEVVARAIHEHSPRRHGPFVPVNCAALPEGLLESEMFGHVRGAFTGATQDRVGRFEQADRGTLFLDEVAEMPPALQAKLLRVLQSGEYERVGETQLRYSRARVIAATNSDLRQAVADRLFREDLFYRLHVVPIEVPPLRERREDIEPLANVLLARVGRRHGRALRFSPDTIRRLLDHDWPGNVRELENAIEYAVAVARGQTLMPEDLPDLGEHAPTAPATARRAGSRPPTRGRPTASPDREVLRRALDRNRWRRDATARELGVSRVTLWRWMREAKLMDSAT